MADALAVNPNHNKWFNVYTDTSDYQLGSFIIQKGQPVAYFSPSAVQITTKLHSYGKGDALAMLDEFQGMLLGYGIHVFTNHKNLTFNTFKVQQVLSWCNRVKEFSPILCYIEGPYNILADNLPRLHRLVTRSQIT
ncbi:hypothetical protein ACHAW6_008616 [Cyclotella cf. meneghiniana]